MPDVHFIQSDGTDQLVEVPLGENLKQAAIDNLVPGIIGDCGGFASCGTCHAYIDESFQAALDAPSEDEEMVLEGILAPVTENSRLTCQVRMVPALDGVVVRIPDEQI